MIRKSFRVFAVPLFQDNYSYIVQTSKKQPLLLVDPANPDVIMDCLNRYFQNQPVSHILYTHKHYDHAGGSSDLFKTLSTKNNHLHVYAGAQDATHIPTVTHKIQAESEMMVNNARMRVYKVPCHTRGHVIYHFLNAQSELDCEEKKVGNMQTMEGKKIRVFEEEECAFSGDTLFSAGIGKFFEGNASQMYSNLNKINKNLNPKCSIFNGHQYTLSILKWAIQIQPQNKHIKALLDSLLSQESNQICTLPTTTKRQSQINVFFRAAVINQNKLSIDGVQYLRILREAKNANASKLEDFM